MKSSKGMSLEYLMHLIESVVKRHGASFYFYLYASRGNRRIMYK